jgi:hypothetical protein
MQGKKLTWKVKLWNSTDSEVKIVKVDATCGCTTTSVNVNKVTPSNFAVLTVVFDSGSFLGKQTKYVFVHLDNGEKITILIFANVVKEYSLSEKFIKLPKDQEVIDKVVTVCSNNGDTDFAIKSVTSDSDCVKVDKIFNKKFRIIVKRTDDCGEESIIHIKLDNGKKLECKLFVEKKNKYGLSPVRLVLLNLSRKYVRKIKANIEYEGDFKILDIKPSLQWLKVDKIDKTQNGYMIIFSADIKSSNVRNTGFGNVIVKLKENETVDIIQWPVVYSVGLN